MVQIKNLFGVGFIYISQKSISYHVKSFKDLKIIIAHFDKYPLITDKFADYQLFKLVFDLISRNEHIHPAGLRKIVAIKAQMNRGQLSDKLNKEFPDLISVDRPLGPAGARPRWTGPR